MCICLHPISLEVKLLINHHRRRSERWLVIAARRPIVRSSPAKVNPAWLRLKNVAAAERQRNHVGFFFGFFFKAASFCCVFSLQALVLGGLQRSIFDKHIMKTENKPVNAAAGRSGPSHLWLPLFPRLFVHSRLCFGAVPQRPLFLQKHS